MANRPNTSNLGRWLRSWIQPSGAIHGFHNHSVWGDNPFRHGDFTSGHSTFAAPLLAAVAAALRERPDERGVRLLRQLVDFQCASRQENGQFKHVGFQIGETLKHGLIHNVVPCFSLCMAAGFAGEILGTGRLNRIREAVAGVLDACDRIYGPAAHEGSCSNQEYARQWARLAFDVTFGTNRREDIQRDLHFLLERLHVYGVPDADSAGSVRVLSIPHVLEPAEYYGLMIFPLVDASLRYEDAAILDGAKALARHVVDSAWTDKNDARRLHRMWWRIEDRWEKSDEPMLIGGAGITLAALQHLHNVTSDSEVDSFLGDMDVTYARYQHPDGFFIAASGWGSEPDMVPSSAWQSHDLLHLVLRHGVPNDFWDVMFSPQTHVSVLLGPSLIWMETEEHWTLRGYAYMNGFELAGRKDTPEFGIDIHRWIRSGREVPEEWVMPDQPVFTRTNQGIYRTAGREDVVCMEVS